MTKKQFEKLISKQLSIYYRKRSKVVKKTPYDKQYALVEKMGWRWFRENDSSYWTQDGNCGVPLPCAFQHALYQQEKLARTKLQREHKAKILCNKCGADCAKCFGKGKKDHGGYYGLIEQEVSGGYLSTDLSDCVRYRFSLCEACLLKLFLSFKKPLTAESYM